MKENKLFLIVRLLFLISLLAGAIALYFFDQKIKTETLKQREISLQSVHNKAEEQLIDAIEDFSALVSGIKAYVHYSHRFPSSAELQSFINEQLTAINYRDSIVVSFLDTAHIFRYSFTQSEMDPVGLVGTSLESLRDKAHLKRVDSMIRDENLHMLDPFNLREGWIGAPLNFGIKREGKLVGYIAPIISLRTILDRVYRIASSEQYVFRFLTADGFEFDREKIYDESPVYNVREDPEYYKNFQIDPSSFIYSDIQIHGLSLKMGTAYKSPYHSNEKITYLMYGWFLTLLLLASYVVREVYHFRAKSEVEKDARLEHESTLKAVIDSAIDGFMTIDERGNVISINPAACTLFAYDSEEVIGKNVKLLMPQPYHDEHDGYLKNYLNTGERKIIGIGREVVGRKKNGDTFPFRLSVSEIQIGNKKLFSGIIHDLTELKKTTAINTDISKIVEESLNEIFIFDATSFKFVQVNKGGRLNLGYSQEELNELTPIDIKPEYTHSSFLKLVEPLLNQETEKIVFETVHERKNHTKYPVEIHLQYSYLGNQSVFVAIILDISDRKESERKILDYSNHLENKVTERTQELSRSEAKLKESLEKEKELGEMKSRFVSMASHEFRTPLATILTSTNLIDRYHDPAHKDKRIKHISRIKSSVQNMRTILDDFLSLSKLEEGKIEIKSENINLVEFLKELSENLQGESKEGQTLLFNHNSSETDAFLDPQLLQNICINLISNAIKYSEIGKEIHLNSYIEESMVKIEVIDQGIGIPEEEQKHMFTRFFRANNVTNIQGTGLGLTIVQRYVELMDGSISFVSKPEQGTTFTVILPKGL